MLAIAAVALLGGLAFFWFLREPDAPKDRKVAAQPAYRMQIEGLRFYGMNQGRRVVSITADRFTLRRGKIGFFSTGLTRAAMIENAVIDIYAAAPAPSSQTAPPSDGKFDFGGLFAEETFSSLFPARNIAEIVVSPVTVRLHDDKSVLTEITAAKASVRLKDKEILFTGNVRVSAAGAALTTEQLSFLPGTSRLRTNHPFVLKRGDRTLKGANLTTDLFLQPQ
ncbi:MAG: LPS export ABC transporter periplasmic protein LptC [Syntrophaceae bacterium]|nr:LPS export ABC transporter periplasmic protein LptC [Syntrophaceae bacterium]